MYNPLYIPAGASSMHLQSRRGGMVYATDLNGN